jgi:hypothetical protein
VRLSGSGSDLSTPVEAAAVYAALVARRRAGEPWEGDERDAVDLRESLADDLGCDEDEVDERLAARIEWAVSRLQNQSISIEPTHYGEGGFRRSVRTLGDAEHFFVVAMAQRRLAQVCGLPAPSDAADVDRLRAVLAAHLGVDGDLVVSRYDDRIAREIADTVFPWKLRG